MASVTVGTAPAADFTPSGQLCSRARRLRWQYGALLGFEKRQRMGEVPLTKPLAGRCFSSGAFRVLLERAAVRKSKLSFKNFDIEKPDDILCERYAQK